MVAALVVAGLLVLAGDRLVLDREVDVLVRRVQEAHEAAVYADRRLSGTVQYAGAALTSASVPAAVRADLRRLVQDEAAGQVAPLQAVRDRVADAPVLPWHGDVRRARRAALLHVDERVAHLREVSRDARALYSPRTAVTRSGAQAQAALAELVPPERAARLYR